MPIQSIANSGPNWDLPVDFVLNLVSFFFFFETSCLYVKQSSFPAVETFRTTGMAVLSLYPAPQRHYQAWMILSLSLGLEHAQSLEMTLSGSVEWLQTEML